jgi:hypothetical protein
MRQSAVICTIPRTEPASTSDTACAVYTPGTYQSITDEL